MCATPTSLEARRRLAGGSVCHVCHVRHGPRAPCTRYAVS